MRRLLCLFLLICLPLHSFAMQLGGVHALIGSGLVHEVVHDQGIEHHHDQDGSIHYDQSDESEQHVQEHCGAAQFILPVSFSATLPGTPQGERPLVRPTFIPHPHLEDPDRPPVPAPGFRTGG